MTMTYCGRCGSANGTAARYCRSCGAELSNQAAFSTPAAPLNVEFSARSTPPKESKAKGATPGKSSTPRKDVPPTTPKKEDAPGIMAQPEAAPPPPPVPPPLKKNAAETAPAPEDPKAISERLRRLRASGPLLLDAARKKQERFNEIIAESIEGLTPDKTEPNRTPAPPAPPKQSVKPPSRTTNKIGTPKPPAPPTSGAKDADAKPAPPAAPVVKPPAPVVKPPAPVAASTPPPAPRRASGQLTLPSAPRNTGALPSLNAAPSQGPASVLVQASGLKTQSNMGSRLLFGLIALVFVMAATTYFTLRDRLVAPSRVAEVGRNLVRAEDQSAELMSAGVRDREQGDLQAAINNFRNALALTPNNQEALYQLAQTQARAGQADEALKTYQALLRRVPEHLEARLQVAHLQRARNNWDTAYREYQRIIALDQNSAQATAALEAIEAREGKKPVEVSVAKAARPRVVAKHTPLLPPVHTAQAQVSLLPQRIATASSINPPAVKNSPEEKPADPRALADPHKRLGMRYFNIREYRAAINEFLAALRLTPGDKDLYYLLGSSYHGLNQPGQAYEYYRRVDSGPYRDVSEAGARATEKAAREEFKRREALRNELKNEAKDKTPRSGTLNNSLE